MKGLKHNVIEICDTQNDNIDKILVFLKPEATNVALMTTRAQAAEMIKELDIKKTSAVWRRPKLLWGIGAAVVIIAAAVILFV
ncbi:MAG: hypothetical protein IKA10_00760 [Oscillospiraceae bacterium]|nr:hypothetical protein [Oscillospiraceae bacterium]